MNASFLTYWRTLANGTRNGIFDRLLLGFLIPLSLPYAMVQYLRSGLYRYGILKAKRLPRPVISVGNITVGGTGKTPFIAYIARMLLEQGVSVAVLSRGYGGTLEGTTAVVSDGRKIFLTAEECGDEPYLLAKSIPGLMIVIGVDRHAAGLLAMEQLSPDIFLLDDGFQHLRLHRDMNILLLDCTRPFGNGWTLPAGLLREPRWASLRADWIIHTRCTDFIMNIPGLEQIPQMSSRHKLVDAVTLCGGAQVKLATLKGLKIVAFAGIANPQSFFDELRLQGMKLVAAISFPDHVDYHDNRIAQIRDTFRQTGADWAITTEKDGVKLNRLSDELAKRTLLARLDLAIDDPALLNEELRNLLQ